MPKAWQAEAQAIDDEREAEGNIGLILRNRSVNSFLDANRKSSTIVVGPKGYGKTLLLNTKRVSLSGENIRCLPTHAIVDRPIAAPATYSYDAIGLLSKSESWASLWAISIAILLTGYAIENNIEKSDWIRRYDSISFKFIKDIIDHREVSVFSIMNIILRLTYKQMQALISKSGEIISSLSYINVPLAYFIDNIDDYFQIMSDLSEDDSLKEQMREFWYLGQIGFWKCTRRLQGLNSRIKIYSSLRKEAYYYAHRTESQIQNMEAFAVKLKYSRLDLELIIKRNIEIDIGYSSSDTNLLVSKFVRKEGLHISNLATGEVEDLLEYWLRHCIHRPRDAVIIGGAISDLSPEERVGSNIKAAIASASEEQVQRLFNETEFLSSILDVDILPMAIRSNVLSEADLASARELYKNSFAEKNKSHHSLLNGKSRDPSQIFSLLYALGLIGVVRADPEQDGKYNQYFAEFGTIPINKDDTIPMAMEYLVHPALCDFLIHRNATFVSKLNKQNVIGNGREWKNPDTFVYAAVADIAKYRQRVAMKTLGPAFEYWWDQAVRRIQQSHDTAHFDAFGGDSLVIADPDAKVVYSAFHAIAIQLKNSKFDLDMRVGAHAGFWNIAASRGSRAPVSDLLSTTARIEALAKPGEMLGSEQFWRGLIFDGLNPGDSALNNGGVMMNISKDHEYPENLMLYALNITS